MENQSAGVSFLTSIPYIKKKWKEKRGKSICWSCSTLTLPSIKDWGKVHNKCQAHSADLSMKQWGKK